MSEWSAFLNRPGTEWMFLILPVVVFSVVGLAIYGHRRRQLSRWNLRDSQFAPSTAGHRWLSSILAILAFVMLVSITLGPDIAPDQRNWDIGLGIPGILIGWAGCPLSIYLANRSYLGGTGQ